MIIGIQGIAGSYSEMTAQDYINRQSHKPADSFQVKDYSSFKEVTEALINEEIDLMVVPVENSTTGEITKMLDELRYKPVMALAEAYQPVRHTLWGVEGSSIEQLKMVYSHPEALSQCETFFARYPQIEAKAYGDTAKSAKYIKSLNRPDIGAISSPRAGELYQLLPLSENIQTEKSNTTRFYIVEKKGNLTYQGSQLSFYIETRHEAGALLKVLQVFDIFNGNLQSLTARPIENQPFTYGFFLEVSIAKMTSSVDILVQTLEQVAEHVQLIGQFNPVLSPNDD